LIFNLGPALLFDLLDGLLVAGHEDLDCLAAPTLGSDPFHPGSPERFQM
jgi:hypothetical protein